MFLHTHQNTDSYHIHFPEFGASLLWDNNIFVHCLKRAMPLKEQFLYFYISTSKLVRDEIAIRNICRETYPLPHKAITPIPDTTQAGHISTVNKYPINVRT